MLIFLELEFEEFGFLKTDTFGVKFVCELGNIKWKS